MKRGNTSVSTQMRYAEYYDMVKTFDELYLASQENRTDGLDLYSIITNSSNILLAYRTIKSNAGSNTAGVDKKTIKYFKGFTDKEIVEHVRKRLVNYKPQTVRRVEIPKPNGSKRPLGIPTISDRLIQQCIKQVIEPIAEAKFYKHSYGFRPLRSARHAVARSQFLINKNLLRYVVDIDIKGFFDNVNHNRLIKQVYGIGIKDPRVTTIISKMLKAPVSGIGTPNKGTPQGGILSPLLSNIVLNDLDQWINTQWEEFPSNHTYSINRNKFRALKKTNLKEMFIVRYADDFKIFTRDYETAVKMFASTKEFLKKRLSLDISEEKSGITNLKKKSTEFLGFSIKAKKKGTKWVTQTNIVESKIEDIIIKAREHIKKISKHADAKTVFSYNSFVMGIKNYFQYATNVNIDLSEVEFRIRKSKHARLKGIAKQGNPINPPQSYVRYHKNKNDTYTISGIPMHVFSDIRTVNNMNFSQHLTPYTEQGREEYEKLKPNIENQIVILSRMETYDRTVEYIDNRLSKYSMQNGKCSVTGEFLLAKEIHCHHIKPKASGGTDEYKNLTIVSILVHRLIHATDLEIIRKYLNLLELSEKQIRKLNKYRKECNLETI